MRFPRRAGLVLLAALAALTLTACRSQNDFDPTVFQFGVIGSADGPTRIIGVTRVP